MKKEEYNLNNLGKEDNIKDYSFSASEGVNTRKNPLFKVRCESAINSTGLSNKDFYLKTRISRQQWYFWSWGIEEFPEYVKIRLCDIFGKPFRDLFLSLPKKEELEE